ncbi:MAG: type II secretion system protein [Planctomycetes bacterium]|nr:type II secretion system protein [Planctomycetota bacterium]
MVRLNFGYTLFEVLLVLAVISAFAAIVWPPLLHLYSDYQLREAAEQVRMVLSKAHLRALDEGIIYQFRFEPEGQHYLILPYEADYAEMASDDSETSPDEQTACLQFSATLPDGMQFGEEEETDELFQPLSDDQLANLPDSRDLESVAWSAPVLFYPDGTAMDTKIRVRNSQERYVELRVRGLTGSVRISKVQQEPKQ